MSAAPTARAVTARAEPLRRLDDILQIARADAPYLQSLELRAQQQIREVARGGRYNSFVHRLAIRKEELREAEVAIGIALVVLVNFRINSSWTASLLIASGNTLEVPVGTPLICRMIGGAQKRTAD